MRLSAIHRYPIKGFAAESLEAIDLQIAHRLPGDRIAALRHQDRVPPVDSGWRPKKYFLQSVQTDLLAEIQVDWAADAVQLTHRADRLTLPRPLPKTTELADWIAARIPDHPGFVFTEEQTGLTDEPEPFVSLINQATVDAIAEATGTRSNPARYRGNLVIEGTPAFAEADWVGAVLTIGEVSFDVIEPTVRCLATECDWQGQRDVGFVERLKSQLDTDCCGVFLKVRSAGRLRLGEQLQLLYK